MLTFMVHLHELQYTSLTFKQSVAGIITITLHLWLTEKHQYAQVDTLGAWQWGGGRCGLYLVLCKALHIITLAPPHVAHAPRSRCPCRKPK